jgi:hypothetical protein
MCPEEDDEDDDEEEIVGVGKSVISSVGCSPPKPVGATDVTAVDGVGAPVVGVSEMMVGTLTGFEVGGVVGPPVGKSVGTLVGGDVGAAVIVTLHPSYPAPEPAQQSSYM